LLADRRKGTTLDAQLLDLGSIVFFTGLTALTFTDPTSPIQHFDGPLSSAWLALIAIVSLLVRRPFTQGIARHRVTAEIAATPQFAHLNTVITSFWAGGFVFGAVAGTIASVLDAGTMMDVARQVIAFAVPMYLTHRYVARVRRDTTATAATMVQMPALTNAS
jgi:p-aminobenzoyl-glutamate transporter AbgT